MSCDVYELPWLTQRMVRSVGVARSQRARGETHFSCGMGGTRRDVVICPARKVRDWTWRTAKRVAS